MGILHEQYYVCFKLVLHSFYEPASQRSNLEKNHIQNAENDKELMMYVIYKNTSWRKEITYHHYYFIIFVLD